MICAGYPPGGKDACQADSGGPLLEPGVIGNQTVDFLVGIVSFGVGCARKDLGAGYTDVSHYRQWVTTTMSHFDWNY